MSSNGRSSRHRFLPHAIRTFLWGRSTNAVRPPGPVENRQGQAPLNPTEAEPPPTHPPAHEDFDARSDSSMPDLLSEDFSDSDSSQDARDVEMDIALDDHDNNWVDEDEAMHPHRSTRSLDQTHIPDRRARIEDEVEPPPSHPNPTPTPAAPPRPQPGAGASQPFTTLPPWNFGLGTARLPGQLFPLFPNAAGLSTNTTNADLRRDDTPVNSIPQPTQTPQAGGNPVPENAQQNARGPRFRAHTFVVGMDGTGRAIPIPPDAVSALLNQFIPATSRTQAQTPQPGQPTNQQDESRDQPRQPGDAGQIPPFDDFVLGGIGTLPPFFPPPGQGPQPEPGAGGGPEPGRGAPAWAELLRAMLGGEPPEEKEDPERAKKLVKGLERVPEGLVKRMTRVDSVPGAHEDSTGAGGSEVPGCAICWDNLLPEEPSEGAKLQFNLTASLESEHPTEGSDSNPTVSEPVPGDDTSTAIICLPCSHVFHASCLIPWFSKPKHTTCPTCRFDIDPRNLTYTPPSRRPRPTPTTTTTNATPSNNPQAHPVSNATTAPANPPLPPPSTSQGGNDDEQPPPLGPPSHDGTDEGDRYPLAQAQAEPPTFTPNFFAAQPQQGPDPLPGGTRDEVPNNRHDTPIFEFEFGPQRPPVFGPPPPPGHPTYEPHPTAANVPHERDNGPHHEGGPQVPPDFSRGGVGHAHFHAPGFALDFTLHVPPEQGLDAERISQAVRDQAAAFLRFFAGGGRGPGTGQPTGPSPNSGPGGVNRESEDAREWMPPPAPGPTLRQRVEAKERKAGLRCDDPSCGIGPSDEDPFPGAFNDPTSPSIKRIEILKDGGDEAVCGHAFHPACLVSADRCAGWGEKDRPSQDGIAEYEVVSCPVCRGVGKVQMAEWEEGAKALLV